MATTDDSTLPNAAQADEWDKREHAAKIGTIRRALYIGLASFGEIVRLDDAASLADIGQHTYPKNMKPILPTGDALTVSEFAEALRFLEELAEMPLTA